MDTLKCIWEWLIMLIFAIVLIWWPLILIISSIKDHWKNPINYVIWHDWSNHLVREIVEEKDWCVKFIYRTWSKWKVCWEYEIHKQNSNN